MNKAKVTVLLGAVAIAGVVFAGPHGPGPGCHPCRPGWHRPPPVVHHHHGGWGRGGRNFWPGFVGGVVGGMVGSAIVSQPVVVSTPVVTTPVVATTPVVVTTPAVATTTVATPAVAASASTVQNVWVEGRYLDQVQANGTVVRTWQPGHYETRTVIVQ